MNNKREKCFLCDNKELKYLYHDFKNNKFVICSDCGMIYQDDYKSIPYENMQWGTSIDPDGKSRNLLEEREQKLRNWYGDIIEFLNNQKGGDNTIKLRNLQK